MGGKARDDRAEPAGVSRWRDVFLPRAFGLLARDPVTFRSAAFVTVTLEPMAFRSAAFVSAPAGTVAVFIAASGERRCRGAEAAFRGATFGFKNGFSGFCI